VLVNRRRSQSPKTSRVLGGLVPAVGEGVAHLLTVDDRRTPPPKLLDPPALQITVPATR
jgi:hypothetical protein